MADDRKILQNMPDDIPLIIVLNKVDKIRTVQKEAMYKMVTDLENSNLLRLFQFQLKKISN